MVSDWMVAVNDYISDYSGVYSDVTIKDRRRRLVRIGRTISALRSAGRISTTDPGRFTVEDAKQIMISFRSRKDITPNTIMDLQGAINRFCRYHGNSCFEDARYRYPVLYNKKQYVRLPVLTHQDFRDLMFYLSRPGQSYNDLRGSAAVSLSFCGGLRPQEVRMLRADDLDLDAMLVRLHHVKGKDTFGLCRTVPLHPFSEDVLRGYLGAFRARGCSGYLFQNSRTGEPLSSNTMRVLSSMITRAAGLDASYRMGRRTWGQLLEDSIAEESVSVLMGHSSTSVTNRYYARTKQYRAISEARKAWSVENADPVEPFRVDGSARGSESSQVSEDRDEDVENGERGGNAFPFVLNNLLAPRYVLLHA